MKNWKIMAAVLVAVLALAGGLYAVSGIDFVDGQKIPDTLTANRTHSGTNTFSGATVNSGAESHTGVENVTFTNVSTTYTLGATDRGLLVDTGGGAYTVTLGAATAGRVVPVYISNGTNAVTLTNVNHGTYNALNAVGESVRLLGYSTTYLGLAAD